MRLQRISVVMPLVDPSTDIDSVIPVFHRWIKERRLEGLPIDVARYGHVPNGPGIILIGFEGDIAIEETTGVPALRYTLKRAEDGDAAQHVVLAIGRLLEAAAELEKETDIRVDRSSVTVRIADKLNAPNTDENRQAFQSEVVSAVTSTFGFAAPDIIGGSTDPRDALSWTIRESVTAAAA